ncbi:ATP-binding protein [Kineococcus sp. DHX-1]|uniref:sensor histidine kinase n=1 Tax=Kineococcus sp. DHX-1 TaxID=3349638 RepID=UPI0036D43628
MSPLRHLDPSHSDTHAHSEEDARRAALRAHDLLAVPETPDADPELDAVVRLALAVTGASAAAVDLLDAHRQLRLATTGTSEGTDPARGTTDRRESLAARLHTGRHAASDVVVVHDARRDPRLRDSSWVDGRLDRVVFAASTPLRSAEGHLLGSLSVTAGTPRDLTGEQADRLRDLAGLAVAALDRRRRRQVTLLAEVEHQRALLTAALARTAALEAAGERLRRSNDELTHLAAVAGHDLAAPLTAVIGYLDLVLDVHRGDLGAQGSQWLGTALRAAHRMQGLIEAVLVHSLADGERCHPRRVDVRDVLRHVVEDLGTSCAAARIGYTEVPAPGGTLDPQADPVLLRQLLQNLLANAVRHRRPDRPCRIEVTVTALPAGGWELAVADNGHGIPADQRDRVFAMFTSGPAPGGHGIGLATCRRIVTRHGGSITAEPTPGGGATLRATFFPANPPAPPT